jgi:peptidoglycan/LPS O-acetylase OafA/YrhL
MIPAMAAPQKRIPELDGIRGLAILLVLLYHYVSVPIPADAAPGLLFIRQLFSNGWSGVDLFFVLSGFLITGILVDNRSAGNYYRVFYLRRINRIFPLYYFFLFLFLALQRYSPAWGLFSAGLFENPLPTGPYFIYLQNFAMAARGAFGNEFLAMTWSLAIEEQFYLFLPLLVRASPPRLLPLNVLFFLGIPLALRATLGDAGFYGFVLTPWRLDSLFLGALLALVVRSPTALDFLKARLSWVKAAFYGLLLFYLYSSLAEEPGSLDHFFTFALFYACLLFLPPALPETAGADLLRHLHVPPVRQRRHARPDFQSSAAFHRCAHHARHHCRVLRHLFALSGHLPRLREALRGLRAQVWLRRELTSLSGVPSFSLLWLRGGRRNLL